MDSSLPDLRGHLAALIGGVMPLDRFLESYFANADTIEFEGSDEDAELPNLVFLVYAEYTSDSIDAAQLLDGLRTDPLVRDALGRDRIAVA
ncbi:MAG: hypothetical protein U0031_06215 [Thermomicrobiales bacterium]